MSKYHIITIGCQMNISDSEKIAGFLNNIGWNKISTYSMADLVIITTCGIKQSAEDRIYGLIPAIKRSNKNAKIMITGCLSQRKDVISRLKDRVDIWLPITELPKLGKELDKIYNHKDTAFVENPDYLEIKAARGKEHTAFVPIGNGCNNFCSYCVVPYARGREKYRDHRDILAEVLDLLKRGYLEINLIAQNVNSYKSPSDGKVDFTALLNILEELPHDFWLRFYTSHPKDMNDSLIDFIGKSKKLCNNIHLPAQAGNDRILNEMNRKYKIEDYLELINKIRILKPDMSVTTDIIVGFPSETREEFLDTVKLFEKANFDMAYISKFSPRPGTVAAKMVDNISLDEKKEREKELVSILRQTSFANNQKYLNQEVDVLVEEESDGFYYGRTKFNRDTKITKTEFNLKMGSIIKAKITKVNNFSFMAEIVDQKYEQ